MVTVEVAGVGHDRHPEEGTVQVIVWILSCPVCGAGVYWHFDHDCTGWPTSASFPIQGEWTKPIAASEVTSLRDRLLACPDTRTGRCGCPAHQRLRAVINVP